MNNVTVLAPQRGRDLTASQLDLVRRTVAADCDPTEFNLFIEVCRRVGLDPFRKQIYAVVYNKDKPDKRKMSIITGIDGFRAVAARGGTYRPDENEPEIVYREELKNPQTNPLGIERAVVTCHKFGPDGQWRPLKGVAYWEEFAPLTEVWKYDQAEGKRKPSGEMELSGKWKTMPRVMISKVAEAQAIRKGWPEDLSGVYAPEEMDRATVEDISAADAVEQHRTQLRLDALNAGKSVPIQWKAGEAIEYVPDGQVFDRAAAFVREAVEGQLNAFMNINRHSLQEYWARNKADALELKKIIEKRAETFKEISA